MHKYLVCALVLHPIYDFLSTYTDVSLRGGGILCGRGRGCLFPPLLSFRGRGWGKHNRFPIILRLLKESIGRLLPRGRWSWWIMNHWRRLGPGIFGLLRILCPWWELSPWRILWPWRVLYPDVVLLKAGLVVGWLVVVLTLQVAGGDSSGLSCQQRGQAEPQYLDQTKSIILLGVKFFCSLPCIRCCFSWAYMFCQLAGCQIKNVETYSTYILYKYCKWWATIATNSRRRGNT